MVRNQHTCIKTGLAKFGLIGIAGMSGINGISGITGITGISGITGITGITGTTGINWQPGGGEHQTPQYSYTQAIAWSVPEYTNTVGSWCPPSEIPSVWSMPEYTNTAGIWCSLLEIQIVWVFA